MTLQNLGKVLSGRFELTVYDGERKVCEDEEIYTSCREHFDLADYLPEGEYEALKNRQVKDIYLTENRNYNGSAVWVTL